MKGGRGSEAKEPRASCGFRDALGPPGRRRCLHVDVLVARRVLRNDLAVEICGRTSERWLEARACGAGGLAKINMLVVVHRNRVVVI
jgi:hypothetical protein